MSHCWQVCERQFSSCCLWVTRGPSDAEACGKTCIGVKTDFEKPRKTHSHTLWRSHSASIPVFHACLAAVRSSELSACAHVVYVLGWRGLRQPAVGSRLGRDYFPNLPHLPQLPNKLLHNHDNSPILQRRLPVMMNKNICPIKLDLVDEV